MKYYLSSYKIGNQQQKLLDMIKDGNRKVAYINNALDFATDLVRKSKSDEDDIREMAGLGFDVDILDLKQYFYKTSELESTLEQYDVIWVRGGNTFVLAQAMQLSGFDKVITNYHRDNKDKVYGGYSAGACILGPTLKGIHLADDPAQKPYGEQHQTIWHGLGIIDYVIAPHYQSDHPESRDIDRVVEYLKENRIPYQPLRDGEVIIIDNERNTLL